MSMVSISTARPLRQTTTTHTHTIPLESRIDWFTFEREHAKDALVDAVEGLLSHESFECLHS